ARSAISRLSGLFVSLRPDRAEEMETDRRKRTNACRRDWPLQKRYPNRPRNPAPPGIDRQCPRPRHGDFPPSGASPLAQLVIVAASLCRGIPPTSSSALVRRKRRRRHSLDAAYIEIFCVAFVEEFDRDPIDTTRIL